MIIIKSIHNLVYITVGTTRLLRLQSLLRFPMREGARSPPETTASKTGHYRLLYLTLSAFLYRHTGSNSHREDRMRLVSVRWKNRKYICVFRLIPFWFFSNSASRSTNGIAAPFLRSFRSIFGGVWGKASARLDFVGGVLLIFVIDVFLLSLMLWSDFTSHLQPIGYLLAWFKSLHTYIFKRVQ